MDIIVLGSRGMLGQMVFAYFSSFSKYNVIKYDGYFTQDNFSEWGSFLRDFPEAVVINCVGRIKQKSNDPIEMSWSNSLLPLVLSSSLLSTNYLIHASTDCVFSGKKGEPYLSSDMSDSQDIYGWSKRMGEIALLNRPNALIVRVSIIGPNKSSSASDLLSWFLGNPPGSQLKGYENHLWNGITTLEWAKKIEEIINERKLNGIIQLGTEKYYSKYDMLLLFNKCFKKNFIIDRYHHAESIDRRLKPDIVCDSLEFQIAELIEKNYTNYEF